MIGEEAAKLLWDARNAAERIARFTAGHSFDDYLNNDLLRAGVERQFEIIGEAFAGLRRIDPALAAGIPDLPRIVAFRKVLIHAYATLIRNSSGALLKRICRHCGPLSPSCLVRLLNPFELALGRKRHG